MSVKRVDRPDQVDSYGYANTDGKVETVSVANAWGVVNISTAEATAPIYKDDIPNLIKALQAAYDHKE